MTTTTNDRPDYDEACRRAADAQGITLVVERLRAAGIDAVAEQTGGFCMVATVYGADETWLGVTDEALGSAGPAGARYLVCHYADAEDDGTVVAEDVADLEHVVDYVRGWVRTHGTRS